MRAVTVPEWLKAAYPRVAKWEDLGGQRWRGHDEGHAQWIYAVSDDVRWRARPISDELRKDASMGLKELERFIFAELAADLAEAALPDCAIPGCGEKGTEILTATQHKHFAGKDWEPGNHLHLCLAHTSDVYRSPVSLRDPKDLIAGWLRREWETDGAP